MKSIWSIFEWGFLKEDQLEITNNFVTDGDHPTKDPKGAEKVKEAQEETKDVKRIQTMVRNLLFQAQDILPNSPGKYLIFVHLLTQAPLGMIDYNLPYPQV